MRTPNFKTMLCAVAVATLATGFSSCKKDEPTGNGGGDPASFTHNEHQYLIVKELKTWVDAAADAVKRGGYLAEIGDQAEQDAIYAQIKLQVPTAYTQVPDGGGVAYVWIGATDQSTEGQWVWNGINKQSGLPQPFWIGENNGLKMAYANWGAGEPDNYTDKSVSPNGQNYAAIGLEAWPKGNGSLGKAGEWNDISGSNKIYYVVEIETAK